MERKFDGFVGLVDFFASIQVIEIRISDNISSNELVKTDTQTVPCHLFVASSLVTHI